MTDGSELLLFSCVLTLVYLCFTLSLVSTNNGTSERLHQSAIAVPTTDLAIADQTIADLQQQCLRLRTELHQQKAQLHTDFQDSSFAQLQSLLTNYPTARKMAQLKPDLPASNLTALFTPLDNLLQTWHITPIGTAWEQVPFNAQLHQPDVDDIAEGETVYIRFVGYHYGDRILSPAKVSRTLPGGVGRKDEG
ncbi:MAG: molecular chaperone GrpE [Verrucomicrobia bacterium]|nr:molecular chaperone GrpE [Leptolyngbya sp. ES-bin-22]